MIITDIWNDKLIKLQDEYETAVIKKSDELNIKIDSKKDKEFRDKCWSINRKILFYTKDKPDIYVEIERAFPELETMLANSKRQVAQSLKAAKSPRFSLAIENKNDNPPARNSSSWFSLFVCCEPSADKKQAHSNNKQNNHRQRKM